ncbi:MULTISPECIES: hypothetical protein [Planktothricoides]|uniref:Uncharacterized protein n=1 Tax=Planktothricoides raciborskii FACHB-1370 TaxID=2949576 RepID=A0ABR8EB71_9CYAN|nr:MULTISPECIES: hypothetical protein [Planktothricoides]MBD2543998.1 hypothetical protein [Planktothricoides raciborskii FACHB-1370]MBD2582482.1 hypothetical protein [Planktothricoides raciborskii FACHB-1261]
MSQKPGFSAATRFILQRPYLLGQRFDCTLTTLWLMYLQANSTKTLQNSGGTEGILPPQRDSRIWIRYAIALGWGQTLVQCEEMTFSPDFVAIARAQFSPRVNHKYL